MTRGNYAAVSEFVFKARPLGVPFSYTRISFERRIPAKTSSVAGIVEIRGIRARNNFKEVVTINDKAIPCRR